ncbi:MAG: DUF1501 domain-containing protein, partial [Verrucomicrobiia bacterium]
MNLELQDTLNRRTFLQNSAQGIGLAALASLLPQENVNAKTLPGRSPFLNPAAKAKRIIYLFQSGAPSQMDLFDPKPAIAGKHGAALPDSIRRGQRITTMTSGQKTLPIAPSIFD